MLFLCMPVKIGSVLEHGLANFAGPGLIVRSYLRLVLFIGHRTFAKVIFIRVIKYFNMIIRSDIRILANIIAELRILLVFYSSR